MYMYLFILVLLIMYFKYTECFSNVDDNLQNYKKYKELIFGKDLVFQDGLNVNSNKFKTIHQ